ncbi:substrate-binding periplasmic protein [Aestuariispira insulae]|uniref:ABC-type amino acid transport substrate-binding protein n=1 Tax=Aestuariispira insulae TaxID=1461337 RepID=A0A3D9HXH1_9PROT|nr:ABC transporter substrate-binding protein [Aestuariispira insulae]RED54197.1 ABC-type amino acid transport substrate-binding protein [Aestuariispira insulae]
MIQDWTKNILLFFALFLGSFSAASGQAAKGDNVIRLGFPKVGYPPYLMPQGADQPGIMTAILARLAGKQGYSVQIEYMPDNRALALQLVGNLEASAQAQEWVSGPERFLWTVPIITVADHIIIRKDNPIAISRVEDLHGKSLAAMIGYSYPSFDTGFANGIIIRRNTQNFSSLLKMVMLERTDGAILDRNVALWLFRTKTELQLDQFDVSAKGFDPVGFRFRFALRDDLVPFVEAFDRHFAAFQASGEFDDLLTQYR